MMRQAGRYLPEYRDLREDYSFLEAISTPEVAAEISLQPWERFQPDGVVMYSDILTVLEPLGFSYHLESGVGPVVENPVEEPADTARERGDVREELWYVGDLLERLTDELGSQAAVLGFSGGPFTLGAYVCEGTPSRSFMRFGDSVQNTPRRSNGSCRRLPTSSSSTSPIKSSRAQMQSNYSTPTLAFSHPQTTASSCSRSIKRSSRLSTSPRSSSRAT